MVRRSLVAAVALCAVAAVAPAAQAHPDYDYRGGCFLAVRNDELPLSPFGGREFWNGFIGSVAVATLADGTRPAPNANISVECELYLHGVPLGAGYVSSAKGVGVTTVGYSAYPDQVHSVCAVVTVEGEVHDPKCSDASMTPVVPGPVAALVGTAHGAVHDQACYALAIMAPGLLGVVEVTPEGDVMVRGTKLYDCPVHDDPAPPDPLDTTYAVVVQE